ncbi:MAG: hypothetical protein U5Q03_05080 [Bacteroidota bacterium]|nr:hypothetical protein [Bacteroidota bacterium]
MKIKLGKLYRKTKNRRLNRQIRKELNEPGRKDIIRLLQEKGSMHFGDMVMASEMTQDEVLNNLIDLKQAGVVKQEKSSSRYSLVIKNFDRINSGQEHE